jgi:hypothetical protein
MHLTRFVSRRLKLKLTKQQPLYRTFTSTSSLASKDSDLVRGFETQCLHGGYLPDPTTTSRGVPVYRTTPYCFKSTEHAANLFALKELGNIYSK